MRIWSMLLIKSDLKWCIHLSRSVFLCPRHNMARGHLVFALSVLPSFRHSVPSKFVFSTPPTSLLGVEWNFVQMLYHKSRSACGELFMFDKFWQSYCPWHFEFLHILACLLNSSYIVAWIWMKLGRDLHHKSSSACGEVIHVRQILAELWPLTLWIFTHFSLSSQLLLHRCMDLNETWQGCCTTSLVVHVGR